MRQLSLNGLCIGVPCGLGSGQVREWCGVAGSGDGPFAGATLVMCMQDLRYCQAGDVVGEKRLQDQRQCRGIRVLGGSARGQSKPA